MDEVPTLTPTGFGERSRWSVVGQWEKCKFYSPLWLWQKRRSQKVQSCWFFQRQPYPATTENHLLSPCHQLQSFTREELTRSYREPLWWDRLIGTPPSMRQVLLCKHAGLFVVVQREPVHVTAAWFTAFCRIEQRCGLSYLVVELLRLGRCRYAPEWSQNVGYYLTLASQTRNLGLQLATYPCILYPDHKNWFTNATFLGIEVSPFRQ